MQIPYAVFLLCTSERIGGTAQGGGRPTTRFGSTMWGLLGLDSLPGCMGYAVTGHLGPINGFDLIESRGSGSN